MFERFKNRGSDRENAATRDRRTGGDRRTAGRRDRRADPRRTARAPPRRPRRRMHDAARRQRDEFGGVNWGAGFFGWLVAVGIAALLTGAARRGRRRDRADGVDVRRGRRRREITLGGGIALLVVLPRLLRGGYVAGRMSRFDGGRQGIGAGRSACSSPSRSRSLAVIAGDEYNVSSSQPAGAPGRRRDARRPAA